MRSVFLPGRPASTEPPHALHYRAGFVDGKNSGKWSGAFVGFLLGAVFVAGVELLRAWSRTL